MQTAPISRISPKCSLFRPAGEVSALTLEAVICHPIKAHFTHVHALTFNLLSTLLFASLRCKWDPYSPPSALLLPLHLLLCKCLLFCMRFVHWLADHRAPQRRKVLYIHIHYIWIIIYELLIYELCNSYIKTSACYTCSRGKGAYSASNYSTAWSSTLAFKSCPSPHLSLDPGCVVSSGVVSWAIRVSCYLFFVFFFFNQSPIFNFFHMRLSNSFNSHKLVIFPVCVFLSLSS